MATAFYSGPRIRTNMPAQNAYNALSTAGKKISEGQLRLSTGKRINNASDDVAGFITSRSLAARNGSLLAAHKAAGDAKNVTAIAMDSLEQIGDLVTQIKDMAAQASAGALGTDEKVTLANSAYRLASQIQFITDSTVFGGKQLLQGGYSGNWVTGYSAINQLMTIGINLDFDNQDLPTYKAADVNDIEALMIAKETELTGSATNSTGFATLVGTGTQAEIDTWMAANSTSWEAVYYKAIGSPKVGDMIVTNAKAGENNAVSLYNLTGGFKEGSNVPPVQFNLNATRNQLVTNGGTTPIGPGGIGNDASSNGFAGIANLNLSNLGTITNDNLADSIWGADNIQTTLMSLDYALNNINKVGTYLGGIQTRLNFQEDTLTSQITNYKAAISRIEDADVAEEQMKLIINQFLQSASLASLAQANQNPTEFLQLLR